VLIHADPETSNLPVGAAGLILCNGSVDDKPNARIDAGFAAQPNQLDIPADIEDIVKPLSVAVGDNDLQPGAAGLEKLKRLLDAKTAQNGLKQQVNVDPGAKHSFAVRCNPAEEMQKRRGMDAEEQAVA